MKKNLLWVFALVAIAMVSCQKEKEIINEDNVEVTTEDSFASLPSSFTGTIMNDDTRTAYAEDGKFTWVSSDRVRLLVCQDLTTYSKIGIYSYKIKDGGLSDDGRTAVFTSTSSAGDLTAFVNGDWKSTGIAVYPESALDRFSTAEAHSYGTPWFTLARGGIVTGKKTDIMLTGAMDNDINNFKFSTAMAILKITLRNIPASAAAVKLSTNDKTNYPLDGDFALTKNGNKVDMSLLTSYVGDFKGYQKIDISSEGEIAERTFYFNIPAAEYPANTLSLLIEDADGGMIMKRTIGAKMDIARNECLELPALTYSYTLGFSGGSVTNPRVEWTIDCKRIRFGVSTNPSIDISYFASGDTYANDNTTGSYSSSSNIKSALTNKPSTTGKYYLHYILQSDRGGVPTSLTATNVVSYGTIPFYYSSGDVESTYVGTYSFIYTDGGSSTAPNNPSAGTLCHPGTGSNYSANLAFSTTDDYTKGNVRLTTLYGKGGSMYGYVDMVNNEIVIPYPGDEQGKCFFQQGNYFHIASSSSITNSSKTVMSTTATDNLVFSIETDPSLKLTHNDYLIMKYTASYDPVAWGPFIYGKGLEFTK